MRVAVVIVSGDIGVSPRMQNHVEELVAAGYRVHVVAHLRSAVRASLRSHSVTYHALPTWRRPPMVPYLAYAGARVLGEFASLARTLLGLARQIDLIVVQNPPAIATALAAALAVRVRGGCVVIDWHNFGYTLLRVGGARGIVVRVAALAERLVGRLAGDAHLCVSDAMAAFLRAEWGVRAAVLYDRPPGPFRRLPLAERHAFWRHMVAHHADALRGADRVVGFALADSADDARTSVVASVRASSGGDGVLAERENRCAIVISSTSFTPDENFNVLLDALRQYEQAARRRSAGEALPRLLVLVTGRGPMRDDFVAAARLLSDASQSVFVCNVWLAIDDYPKLLGSADVGVCLHQSSSGLDLPMKVVDMLGCQLPVLAWRYDCIEELVSPAEGRLFASATELCAQLTECLGVEVRPAASASVAASPATARALRVLLPVPERPCSWHEEYATALQVYRGVVELGGVREPCARRLAWCAAIAVGLVAFGALVLVVASGVLLGWE